MNFGIFNCYGLIENVTSPLTFADSEELILSDLKPNNNKMLTVKVVLMTGVCLLTSKYTAPSMRCKFDGGRNNFEKLSALLLWLP